MLILIAILFLVGCVSSGNPAATREDLISKIKIGETTKEDIRQFLGNPQSYLVIQVRFILDSQQCRQPILWRSGTIHT